MAYSNNINPGNAPLKWSAINQAFDRINENFTIIGATLSSSAPETIVNVDNSNPVRVVTSGVHALTKGQEVTISDTGISQIDGNSYYVDIIDAREFELYSDSGLTTKVDGAGFDAYPSSGGQVVGKLEFSQLDFGDFQSDIIPGDTGVKTLGNSTKTWKELHLSEFSTVPGNTTNGLWIGNAQIIGQGNAINLPPDSTVDGTLIIDPDKTFFKEVQVDNDQVIVASDFVDSLNLLSGTAIQMNVDSSAESITINNTGVTQLSGSTGISVSSSTGNVSLTNTGVTSITNTSTLPSGRTSGLGIASDNSTGALKLTNTGILDVQAGFGITVSTDLATGISTVSNSAPAVPAFKFLAVQGNPSTVEANNTTAIATFIEGYGITMVPNSSADTIEFSVNQDIDINGSVYADDSSLMVDAVDNKIYADEITTPQIVGETTLNINTGGDATISSNGNIQLYATSGAIYASTTLFEITGPLTVTGTVKGTFDGDLTGSIYADDSTALVDGVDGAIVGPIKSSDGVNTINMGSTLQIVSTSGVNLEGAASSAVNIGTGTSGTVTIGHSGNNVVIAAGTFTGTLTGDVIGNVTGNTQGYHTGDVTGSIFADDSTLLVDAVDAAIVGPIRSNDIRGDLIGSVFADNSTLIVNGVDGSLYYDPGTPADWNGTAPTTVGEALDRIAAWIKASDGTGA